MCLYVICLLHYSSRKLGSGIYLNENYQRKINQFLPQQLKFLQLLRYNELFSFKRINYSCKIIVSVDKIYTEWSYNKFTRLEASTGYVKSQILLSENLYIIKIAKYMFNLNIVRTPLVKNSDQWTHARYFLNYRIQVPTSHTHVQKEKSLET